MNLEQEIELIKERNNKVSQDKAWEVSWTRRGFIAVMSYVVAAVWLVIIKDSYPFLKAFVPMAGYLLSTLSLPVIKTWWASNQK
jgi:hypothetical protein